MLLPFDLRSKIKFDGLTVRKPGDFGVKLFIKVCSTAVVSKIPVKWCSKAYFSLYKAPIEFFLHESADVCAALPEGQQFRNLLNKLRKSFKE